jgi:hypothetical protein
MCGKCTSKHSKEMKQILTPHKHKYKYTTRKPTEKEKHLKNGYAAKTHEKTGMLRKPEKRGCYKNPEKRER